MMDPLSEGNIGERVKVVEEHIRQENLHDLDAIMETFGQEARYDDEPWGEHHEGAAAVRSFYAGLLKAVPDLFIDVKLRHVTEDTVILEVVISGTHQGAWRGLPATGRRIEFPLCAIYEFDDANRLAGERIYYDRATVLRQIGVYREPTGIVGRIATMLLHPVTITRAVGRRLSGKSSHSRHS